MKRTTRILWAVVSLLTVGPGLFAQVVNCNLAPNSAFEQGSTTIDNWSFAQLSGSATFSVSAYPSAVQSGSRAASVTVTTPGDIFLATAEPGTIQAVPSTAYRLSVRVKSTAGKVAGIRVIEWNGATITADRFLAYNTGTGDWETVEAAFTTTSTTSTLSVRLMHHINSGTFVWDDVMLARDCSGQRCVDARHYVTQTKPGFKMCLDAAGTFCLDGLKTPNKEYLEGQTNDVRNYTSHTLASRAGIGVQKNLDSGQWRCFANPGEACGAARTSPGQNSQFPPSVLSLSTSLPVLSGSPATDRITTGAAKLHDWQLFDVRTYDPSTGLSGGLIGNIFHRTYAYVLSSYNFGGTLGTQSNVLVLEGESIGNLCLEGYVGGTRLERYMMVRGFGVVYAEGREDNDCISSPSPTTCDGVYSTLNPNPTASFVYKVNGDLSIPNDAPIAFNAIDWW